MKKIDWMPYIHLNFLRRPEVVTLCRDADEGEHDGLCAHCRPMKPFFGQLGSCGGLLALTPMMLCVDPPLLCYSS